MNINTKKTNIIKSYAWSIKKKKKMHKGTHVVSYHALLFKERVT